MSTNHPIVFYDGVCGLCDKSVQFLIAQDKHQKLRYAALQSDFAKNILGENLKMDSFLFYKNNKAYSHSTGVLKAMLEIGGAWLWVSIFYIVPPFIRDAFYSLIARNRYKWFGKFEACKIPSSEQRKLFID